MLPAERCLKCGAARTSARPFPPSMSRARHFVLASMAGSVLAVPSTALAIEPEITSDTAAQFYEMRSPTGETVIPRRRFMTTLGVGVYDLIDKAEDPLG